MRVLPHIRKLDDAFGQFRVRITCRCGVSRECEPAALARIAGPAATFAARLRLLKRLIADCALPEEIAAELKAVMNEAKNVQQKRNEIAHGFAAMVIGTPDTPVDKARAGVLRPSGKRPMVPRGGFKSQAQADHHVEHSMHSVTEINDYRDRTVNLNRKARTVWQTLHAMMVQRRKTESASNAPLI